MQKTLARWTGLSLIIASSLAAPDVWAQESKPSDESPPGVSAEELEALQRAMGQDAKAEEKSGHATTGTSSSTNPATETAPPASNAPGTSGGGFSLQSLNPDLAFIADIAAAAFSSQHPLEGGGHDPNANGFTLQQLELSIGKSVDPYFRFDANVVFHPEGVEIEEAYATTLALPERLQVRAGEFLTRFGRLNNTHPHTWAFVDQPFAVGRVLGSEGNRGVGAEVSWLTPLPWFVELVGSVTDAHGAETNPTFFGSAEDPVRSPLDLEYVGAVKQFLPLSDDLSLLWGLSAANGPNPYGQHDRSEIYGTDLYLKYRPISDPSNPTIVSLQAEVFFRRRHVPNDVLQDLNGYAELFWRFDQRWGAAARYELGTPTYGQDGHVVIDPLTPDWLSVRHRVSANVTFWPTEFSRFRLQAGADVPTWREQPIYSAMLAFEFAVGAHGAHTF